MHQHTGVERSIGVDHGILPANVDDPRFSGPESELQIDWGDPDPVPGWLPELIEQLLVALPEYLGHLMRR